MSDEKRQTAQSTEVAEPIEDEQRQTAQTEVAQPEPMEAEQGVAST